MASISEADIRSALRAVDDDVVAEVLRIGPTPEELAEAKYWLANDEPAMSEGRRLAPDRVRRLIELLETADRSAEQEREV